jgi:hypothetical protein
MASASPEQYLQIQIQDDLKYDIRLENAEIHRYIVFPLVVKAMFSEICAVASFTMRTTEAIS